MMLKRIGILFVLTICSACTQDPYKVLENYGYLPMVPANNLIGPGTVYAEVNVGQGLWNRRKTLTEVCHQDSSQLRELWGTSETETREMGSKLRGSTNISVEEIKALEAKLAIKGVRGITRTISNVRVIRITNEDAIDIRNAIAQQNAGCKAAIVEALETGQKVHITQSVLEATVVYGVEYEASLDAQAKAQLTAEIAPTLGADFEISGTDLIRVNNLYIGQRPYAKPLKDTPTLAQKAQLHP